MKIPRKDYLATLAIFLTLLVITEIIRYALEERSADHDVILSLLHNKSEDGRYSKLPRGKEIGLQASQELLKKLQTKYPTREELFPIIAKNYIVQFFVDKSLKVTINENSSSYGSPNSNTPSPFDGADNKQPEQVLTHGKAYQYVTRFYMVEYVPILGQFIGNVAYRKLSNDSKYVLTGKENLDFDPYEADERYESGGGCTSSQYGTTLNFASGYPKKADEVGTFVYRAFLFPNLKMQKTIKGTYLASPPVIIRVQSNIKE